MIVAQFLTKDLLIDWRLGEKYFMQNLIDGDFASNNGGWQWCASTGTDSVPYFRIFNPSSQSEKFDPKGAFILKYVPELKGLPVKSIHDPSSLDSKKLSAIGYPKQIIDHKKARERVLEEFKKLKGGN
jgi:deoxyribodipyrimidine photo-lyase